MGPRVGLGRGSGWICLELVREREGRERKAHLRVDVDCWWINYTCMLLLLLLLRLEMHGGWILPSIANTQA